MAEIAPRKTPEYLSEEQIAKVLHEATRVLTEHLEMQAQPGWEEALQKDREQTLRAVGYLCRRVSEGEYLSVEDIHNEWLAAKVRDGWSFGSAYDEELKKHPLMVAASELPVEQKYKDQLFLAVLMALSFEWITPKGKKEKR